MITETPSQQMLIIKDILTTCTGLTINMEYFEASHLLTHNLEN